MARSRKFKKKASPNASIPTASMADIAFLLLIFFITTTIFKLEDGLPVEMPKAEAGIKIPREKVSHIWIDRAGNIAINDKLVAVDQIEGLVYAKMVENPQLIVAFNVDKQTNFDRVDKVMTELKDANATRISFTADFEKGRGRR